MRKDRVSLDAKMMGPEPLFTDEGVCFNWTDDIEQEARDYLSRPDYVAPIWRGSEHIPPLQVQMF